MNTGTIIRTILAVATVINSGAIATGVAEFENPTVDLIYKILSFAATAVILFINTYFNNDYTETAAKYTAEMRQAKAEGTVGYEGERFFDDGNYDNGEEGEGDE